MVLTIVADLRNSPSNGRPSTSNRTVHLSRGPEQVVRERVDRDFHLAPRSLRLVKARALLRLSLLADDLSDAFELPRHRLVSGDDFIKSVRDLPLEPYPVAGEPHGKVAITHGLQASQDDTEFGGSIAGKTIDVPVFPQSRPCVTAALAGRRGALVSLQGRRGLIVFLHRSPPA